MGATESTVFIRKQGSETTHVRWWELPLSIKKIFTEVKTSRGVGGGTLQTSTKLYTGRLFYKPILTERETPFDLLWENSILYPRVNSKYEDGTLNH